MATEVDVKEETVRKAREAGKRLVEKAKRNAKGKGDTPAHKAVAALRKERRLTREQYTRGADF